MALPHNMNQKTLMLTADQEPIRRIQISVPARMVRALDRLVIAEGQYRARSALVAEAIEQYLDTHNLEPE